DEQRPYRSEGAAEHRDDHECAADRQQRANAQNEREPAAEETGSAVAAAEGDEDKAKATLRQDERVAHGGPCDPGHRIRQAKADESEVSDGKEQHILMRLVSTNTLILVP